ncbi:hypothetical protein EYF80_067702 [Liparis tanakae]|uniref:Uncharacterized protein n=1 Tax=Liparis tanakae TaxID=230148 RepID=A0A4Z2E093_9TELE|nr:hypothetical protein EYF80_067702 [Liparis tanakae]
MKVLNSIAYKVRSSSAAPPLLLLLCCCSSAAAAPLLLLLLRCSSSAAPPPLLLLCCASFSLFISFSSYWSRASRLVSELFPWQPSIRLHGRSDSNGTLHLKLYI